MFGSVRQRIQSRYVAGEEPFPKDCLRRLTHVTYIMDRLFIKLIGLILLVAGVYYLGQNVVFASSFYRYFWRSIPAAASVLCLMGGVITLIYFYRQAASLGWTLLITGIVLVFLSGGVFLRPTTLWQFVVSFGALTVGFKLMTEGRVRF